MVGQRSGKPYGLPPPFNNGNPAQVLKKGLTAPSYKYDSGLRDQNAITYVLKQAWEEHQPHVLLVNKQYCLNCYWRDLLREGDLRSDDTKVRAHLQGTCWRIMDLQG